MWLSLQGPRPPERGASVCLFIAASPVLRTVAGNNGRSPQACHYRQRDGGGDTRGSPQPEEAGGNLPGGLDPVSRSEILRKRRPHSGNLLRGPPVSVRVRVRVHTSARARACAHPALSHPQSRGLRLVLDTDSAVLKPRPLSQAAGRGAQDAIAPAQGSWEAPSEPRQSHFC